MKRGRDIGLLAILAALTLILSACAHAPSGQAGTERPSIVMDLEEKARVPGEYLVSLTSDTSEQAISERYGQFGIAEVTALGDEVYLLVLMRDPGPREMSRMVEDDFRFRGVQANIIYWTHRPANKQN